MTASVVKRLTASFETAGVDWTRSTIEELGTNLESVIDPPVVGSEIDVDNITIDELDIGINVAIDPSLEEAKSATTGITRANFGIADYGSIVLRIDDVPGTEYGSLFVDRHVAILAASDILPDMAQAMTELGQLFRDQKASAIIATGPSATADMGALVYGAHGPMTVHVIILEDR